MRYIYTVFMALILWQAQATVRRVKVGGTGTGSNAGSSWTNAYGDLQTAINNSASGDQVWVALGTYQPAANTSFGMRSGVEVYGGFAGTEGQVTQRNWLTNKTYLSARSGTNKAIMDNSSVDNTGLLDGFYITNGNNTSNNGYGGGGIMNFDCSMRFANLTLSNNFSSSNGGGMYFVYGSPSLTNVVFKSNTTTNDGGGIYVDHSTPTLKNVVFDANIAGYNTSNPGGDGGAIYVSGNGGTTNDIVISNCVFYKNASNTGVGGGMFIDRYSPGIYNCTFVSNTCKLDGGAGIQSYSPSGTATSNQPNPLVYNCAFYNNYNTATTGIQTPYDVGTLRGSVTVKFSMLTEAGNYAGGNVTASGDPFFNSANGAGADGVWLTSDDGLLPHLCNGTTIIDKGSNSLVASSLATDILGNTRVADLQLVSNNTAGTNYYVDMGAYESQLTLTASQLAGSISGNDTIPTPQEAAHNTLQSATGPSGDAVAAIGRTMYWEKSEAGGSWTVIPGATGLTYTLPELSQPINYKYRRVVTSTYYCDKYYSNEVLIRVIQPNGSISGQITSKNGVAGLGGVVVKVVRRNAIPGKSPAGYTYTTTTTAASNGNFTISNIYYGDPATTQSAIFDITATKGTDVFDPATTSRTLQASPNSIANVNFRDLNSVSVAGVITQLCDTCNAANGNVYPYNTKACGLDSVEIYVKFPASGPDSTLYGRSMVSSGVYGYYSVAIQDQGSRPRIIPKYNSDKFIPAFFDTTVITNVSDINFSDTTKHTISGRVTAGCDAPLGIATLEFTNTGYDSACFRRIVRTDEFGNYKVRLPARKYTVRLKTFEPNQAAGLLGDTVVNFINALPKDSLTRDIRLSDTVLNIVYQRAPTLAIISGLDTLCSNGFNRGFAIFQQGFVDSFTVKAFQGSPALGCPVLDSVIRVNTNIPTEDNAVDSFYRPIATGNQIKLLGGTPNIVPSQNYLKQLFVYYADKFGRPATYLNKKVLVTGFKTVTPTYTTVSPQIPLLVLHDPPGDLSQSTWQSNQSIQNAMRIYTGKTNSASGWLEAKIGTKFMAGIGISTETSIWGSINTNISTSSTNTSSGETILTTSTSQQFSTANNPEVIGAQGDVYIGAAMNLVYAESIEVTYKSDSCKASSTSKLAVANTGFKTQYIYTEDHIRNVEIPTKYALAVSNPDSAKYYLDQARVWQQLLDNNANNKAAAVLDKNYSFDGAAGPYTSSTTTSATSSNTIEFLMDIEPSIAASLGLEIAGNGIAGGTTVAFKTETGRSTTNSFTKETTISYTLDDDDNGDYLSVNVKKDPVYNTPVFDLAAGTASCPAEPGAQSRDNFNFIVTNPVVQNVPVNDEAVFNVVITNTSESHDTRKYILSYDGGSNVDGETVRVAGSYTGSVVLDTLPYLSSTTKTVTVTKRPGSSVFSYEGIRLRLSDNCGGDVTKTVLVSAQFAAPCSSISIGMPENDWRLTSAGNNTVFVKPANFIIGNLTGVTLEYSMGVGSNSWVQAAILNTTDITNGYSWNVASMPDGIYNLRLKLTCNGGVVYSQRSTGIIDRRAPKLFGIPQPADDNYVKGDVISFSYDEKLTTSTDSLQIRVFQVNNNASVPATVSSYDNKIVIVPDTTIYSLAGKSIRVIVGHVADQYNNVKTTADTTTFIVGGTPVAVSGLNTVYTSISNAKVYKNSDDSINITFNRQVSDTNNFRINYTIGGTARYGIDYTISYGTAQGAYTFFNGAQGAIQINKNATGAVLKIKPVGDTGLTADKTILITLSDGGYSLGAVTSVTGTITSEDGITDYTFIGDGNFNVKSNWLNGKMPLTTLTTGKQIIINPSGKCQLNVPLAIKPGAYLRIATGKQFIVPGNVLIN